MPRKGKLTPELQAKVVSLLRQGNYAKTACLACGISDTTFWNWRKWGEERKSGKYFAFLKAVKKAQNEAEARYVQVVDHHAFGRPAEYDSDGNKVRFAISSSWQAAMTMLERRHPERWAKTEKREYRGDKEKPVYLHHTVSDEAKKIQERIINASPEERREIIDAMNVLKGIYDENPE